MPKKKNIVTEYRNYYLSPDFPIFLLTGDHWKISDVKSSRLHFHNCLEIGICHSESGCMEFYGDAHYFKAGDITIVPKNIPHTTYSSFGSESQWSYLMMNLNELLADMLPVGLKKQPTFFHGQPYILHGPDFPKIFSLLSQIIDELKEKKTNYQHSVRGLLLVLYIEFLRIQPEQSIKPKIISSRSKDDTYPNALSIAPALDYMEQNYMQNFSIEHLATLCHWSPTHFRRVFHEIMGTSPLDYLSNLRISQACNLLRSTEHSILDISEAVGFHSLSSFNRSFAKIMNTSPREYRKNLLWDKSMEKISIEEYSGWLMPEKLH